MSSFLNRFRHMLESLGAEVTRVNFNRGDELYDDRNDSIAYAGTLEAWPGFCEQLLRQREIDTIFLFGDGRPYHRSAVQVARSMGVQVFVFEEGYLRPNYITIEKSGVNGFSSMPLSETPFLEYDQHVSAADSATDATAVDVPNAFWVTALYSTLYSLALTFANGRFPHYQHHRPLGAVDEAISWVRAGYRKYAYQLRDRGQLEDLTAHHDGRFFFVPLQVYCDFQLQHSDFESVSQFIDHVVRDFAANAPEDAVLVLKHHPLDRGYTHYGKLVATLRKELGLGRRIRYVHDIHLPTLLKHAAGCVTINSTVGLQAIKYGTPVKALGKSVYNFAPLTSQAPLSDFWRDPGRTSRKVYKAFRRWLLDHNQAQGNFYRVIPDVRANASVIWPPALTHPNATPSIQRAAP